MAKHVIAARGEWSPKGTSALDVHVGQRLRLRRTMLGMKQSELADEVGVSFQQLQKYERGETRLTISRLFDIGLVLDVPVTWFLDGLGAPATGEFNQELLDLMRLYSSVDDPEVRRRFLRLARALVEAE